MTKLMKLKYVAIFLVLLCCLMGAASAAEDVSADVVDAVSEDVSDSVESVAVEDEPDVDDSALASNDLGPDVLETSEFYIHNDTTDIGDALYDDFEQLDIDEADGIIYLDEGTFEPYGYQEYTCNQNVTIVGKGIDKTFILVDNWAFSSDSRRISAGYNGFDNRITFCNLTFSSKEDFTLFRFDWGVNFENVKFSNVDIELNYEMYDFTHESVSYAPVEEALPYNFYNCTFANYHSDSGYSRSIWPTGESFEIKGLIKFYCFTKLNFYGCTFENITADSLIHYLGASNSLEEQINVQDSSFINCNLQNGYFDVRSSNDGILNVENCWFESNNPNSEKITVDESYLKHNYYNYTGSYIIAKLTNATAIDYKNPATFKVSLVSVKDGVETDYDGSGFANIPLTYTINGETKEAEIVNGVFTFDADLTSQSDVVKVNVGSQELTFELPEPPAEPETNDTNDTPVVPAKVATKLSAAKVTATYNVAKKLVITLKDANGKALAGKKVTVKVGTISKTLKTNSNGQVSLNVAGLVPKTYTATVKFAGDSNYTASSVSPKVVVNKAKVKIAAKAKTFKVKAKTKKVTATLKDNKGKVMKKAKLTLKVGKKTYTAKTNAKGVATFKVKLTKKGKYTGTVKFAGNKYFKALSKKVKITVKK